jgi:hypothetical protein
MVDRIYSYSRTIAFGDSHQFQIVFQSHTSSCVETIWALVAA